MIVAVGFCVEREVDSGVGFCFTCDVPVSGNRLTWFVLRSGNTSFLTRLLRSHKISPPVLTLVGDLFIKDIVPPSVGRVVGTERVSEGAEGRSVETVRESVGNCDKGFSEGFLVGGIG